MTTSQLRCVNFFEVPYHSYCRTWSHILSYPIHTPIRPRCGDVQCHTTTPTRHLGTKPAEYFWTPAHGNLQHARKRMLICYMSWKWHCSWRQVQFRVHMWRLLWLLWLVVYSKTCFFCRNLFFFLRSGNMSVYICVWFINIGSSLIFWYFL